MTEGFASKRRRAVKVVAFGAAAALMLAACGSSGSSGGTTSPGKSATYGFNAASTTVVNPSTHKGGTLTFGWSSGPDSTDPGNTYAASMWNFMRLYTMTLMTYKSCPGACGLQLVPDLATAPGAVSDNGLTWTYHIQPNVKFENGTIVTSEDIKYAVERSFATSTFSDGPSYFSSLLAPQTPAYTGPYTDKTPGHMGLKAVTTPNPTTIVFHLAAPFVDFNYVAGLPQTAPVLPSVDLNSKTGGSNYQLHPMSTGPYKFQSYQLNKTLTLVPNPDWNPATDPNAKQLASKIIVTMNMNANDLDSRLIANDVDVDLGGTGVQAAARAQILSSATLKQNADDPIAGYSWIFYVNTRVAPLDNVAVGRRSSTPPTRPTSRRRSAARSPAAPSPARWRRRPRSVGRSSTCTKLSRSRAVTLSRRNRSLPPAATRTDSPRISPTAPIGPRRLRLRRRSSRPCPRSGSRHSWTVSRRAPTSVTSSASRIRAPARPRSLLRRRRSGLAGRVRLLLQPRRRQGDRHVGQLQCRELNDPVVNSLLAKMGSTNDATVRNSYTSQIDLQVMKDAAILPVVYVKVLLYRSPNLTNAYIEPYFGEYNYAVLGLE